MGFFSSSKEVESLPGLSPPLGLNSTYSASQQSTLSIKPAKFGGDWTVIDQDGKAVVVCKGVGNTREIRHPQTNDLILQLPSTKTYGTEWALDSAGQDAFSLTEEKNFLKSEIFVRFNDASRREAAELHLRVGKNPKGGVLRQEIVYNDQLVGWIIKESSIVTNSLYSVTVAPGVDLAFLAAVCLCYDTVVRSRKVFLNGITSGGMGFDGGGGGA